MTYERFFFQDNAGNTSHLTDEAGNLLEFYTYSGFGQPKRILQRNWGSGQRVRTLDTKHLLFQGELWLQNAGLNDHRNRHALPTMGVFIQPDPIRFSGDRTNIYRYCGANPVNRRDPFGLTSPNPLDRPLEATTQEVVVFGTAVETANTAGMGPVGPLSSLDTAGGAPGEGSSRDSGGSRGRLLHSTGADRPRIADLPR